MSIKLSEIGGTPEGSRDMLASMHLSELMWLGVTKEELAEAIPGMPTEPAEPDVPDEPDCSCPPGEDPIDPPPPQLSMLPADVVSAIRGEALPEYVGTKNEGKGLPLIYFGHDMSGGAHTWWDHAAEFGLALQSHVGEERTDDRLLAQIRHILRPGSEPTSTGVGYVDIRQIGTLAMLLLARETPRVWELLTEDEMDKISDLMAAGLRAGAFVTSDSHPGADGNIVGINGSGTNRNYNPNFRLGMVGPVILGRLWFGEDAQDLLNESTTEFLRTLESVNAKKSYGYPDSPKATFIDAVLSQPYAYRGVNLDDPMGMLRLLIDNTCGQKKVFKGLNDGAGHEGGGRFADLDRIPGIPNLGKVGMFTEFDAIDGGGPRSSAHYCAHNLLGVSVLSTACTVMGAWKPGEHQELLGLLSVAGTDFRYRCEGAGWIDHEKGRTIDTPKTLTHAKGHFLHLAVLERLQAFHGRGE